MKSDKPTESDVGFMFTFAQCEYAFIETWSFVNQVDQDEIEADEDRIDDIGQRRRFGQNV